MPSEDWGLGTSSRRPEEPDSSWDRYQASPYLPADGTQIPDSPTVIAGGQVRKKPPRSWKRRLLIAALGGLATAALVVGVLAVMSPGAKKEAPAAQETPDAGPPTVSGLRATDRSPTSITIAWHTSGSYAYPHRILIEDGETTYLNSDEAQGDTTVLTGLTPKTQYCIVVDAIYQPAQTPANGAKVAYSSSERRCFSTRK